MNHLARGAAAIALLVGCASRPPMTVENREPPAAHAAIAAPTLPADDGSSRAPWTEPPLSPGQVPHVFLEVWGAAENRAACPVLVPTWLGEGAQARPRPTTFVGGWGVAYDQPQLCADCGDSAFGVAGVGGTAEADTDARWGKHVRWSDGSHAGYGLVGDTGPGWLAYLVINGAGCNYNVWSNVSETHLLMLMSSLHQVAP